MSEVLVGPRDVRALLGMHTTGARVVVALYLTAIAFVAVGIRGGASPQWPLIISWLALAAATIALLVVPDDPLPLPASVAMALAAPLACSINLIAFPVPFTYTLQDFTHGAGTAFLCFMCVRGRTMFAWIGMVGNIAVYAVWSILNGNGPLPGIFDVIIDIGPLAMATVFSLTLRPSANSVFDLRDAGTRRAAQLAAQTASTAERDTQLAELDTLARPMLDRIASGIELTRNDRAACELLEAHLRDRLRAPGLATPDIADAARTARARGREVILIDDNPDHALEPMARNRLHSQIINTLTTTTGDVCIRLLPPHRPAAATILIRGDSAQRREFDTTGTEIHTTDR